MLVLRTPVEVRGEELTTVGDFTVAAGETVPFVLTYSSSYMPAHLSIPDPIDPQDDLRQTHEFWVDWVSTHKSNGAYKEAVSRSLIKLKDLMCEPTGGIVAAPTTTLPEWIGW